MSDLFLNVNILPNTFGNANLTVDAWLASDFLRNPSGQSLPLAGSPSASGTTDGNGDVTLSGLAGAGTNYWVRVIDPLGYFHWFQVNWEVGLTSDDPLVCNFNMPPVGGDQLLDSCVGGFVLYTL